MTVLGTAGHVDHGKSTLVRALTGTDPDTLAAERERGPGRAGARRRGGVAAQGGVRRLRRPRR